MAQEPVQKVKGVVDIVFLIDISGSMGPCIEALKTNIGTFTATMANPDPNGGSPVKDWRIKVAGYSDFMADGSQWWVEFPFVNDLTQVTSNLSSLKLVGGGDLPESLLDGLYKIAKMPSTEKSDSAESNSWRHRHNAARVVIFFTDAEFHPTLSIPEAPGAMLDDVIRELQNSRIILCGFCPEHECYNKLSELDKSVIEFVGTISDAVAKMGEYTSDTKNFQETLKALAKTVSLSAEVVAL